MRTEDREKLLDVIFNAQRQTITIPEQAQEVVNALARQGLSAKALKLFRDEFVKRMSPHVD